MNLLLTSNRNFLYFRSRSSSEERDSSEERYQARRYSHRANRSRRDDYSPPYHSSSKKDDRDRYRYRDHRDAYYRDRDRDRDRDRRYYEDDVRKERSFRDDRSYYDDRRSESGRKASSKYDHERSYYKEQGSSRPSSRAGSVYDERYFDRDRYERDRYDRDRYDRERYDYVMRHAGYHSLPYGIHPSYQPQPAAQPPADPAVLENFQKHWQHYLSHPEQFHELQTSNPAQFSNLNNYYRMYGESLRLPPIPPPGTVVKQEPTDSVSGEPQDERTASRASGQSSEAAAAAGAIGVGASAVDSGAVPEARLEQEASTICTDPSADPRYQPTFMQDQDAAQEYEDVPAPTGRMTPAKFSGPQVRAVFGPRGQMAKVDAHAPSLGQSATVELHSLQLTLESQSRELAAFPGPLVPGRTHKGEVIQFCQAKAAAARADDSVPDKDSLVLIWELLVLLLRQKNAVDGSDIAELLLKDRKASELGGSGRGATLGSCASESVISDAITESAVVFDRSAINHSAATDHDR